jgi:hypothetical protein
VHDARYLQRSRGLHVVNGAGKKAAPELFYALMKINKKFPRAMRIVSTFNAFSARDLKFIVDFGVLATEKKRWETIF